MTRRDELVGEVLWEMHLLDVVDKQLVAIANQSSPARL